MKKIKNHFDNMFKGSAGTLVRHYVKNFSSFWNTNLGQLSSKTFQVTIKSWPSVIVPSIIIMEGISFPSYHRK
jgi:hypothetical protein